MEHIKEDLMEAKRQIDSTLQKRTTIDKLFNMDGCRNNITVVKD